MSENNNRRDEERAPAGGIVLRTKHIVILVILVAVLVAGGLLVGLNWQNWFGNKTEEGSAQTSQTSGNSQTSRSGQSEGAGTDVELDPNAGTWNGSKPEDKQESAPGIKIPGYPTITVEADTRNVIMTLLNPEGNPCYCRFEIVLKDNEESIYTSKYVEPGKAITEVTLDRPLAQGEYPAVIKITTLSLDGKTPLNGANVETVLIAR